VLRVRGSDESRA